MGDTAAAEYLDAKKLADMGVPARVLIMAAILTEDDMATRLCEAYPVLFAETMARRHTSTDGRLPGDQQGTDDEPPRTSLCRDDD